MFKIPSNTEYTLPDIFTDEQKSELCESITKFTSNYMSDNRLSSKLKDNIELNKYIDIVFNINNSNDLLDRILSEDISISDLPWLEHYKLDNRLWKAHIDKRNKNQETREMMATVNIFKCKKCGEMKCTTYQLQTASIDEPMTSYISCKVCGNSWKTH